jgi:hypothetical protein
MVIMNVDDSISTEFEGKIFLFVTHRHGIHFEISRPSFFLPGGQAGARWDGSRPQRKG